MTCTDNNYQPHNLNMARRMSNGKRQRSPQKRLDFKTRISRTRSQLGVTTIRHQTTYQCQRVEPLNAEKERKPLSRGKTKMEKDIILVSCSSVWCASVWGKRLLVTCFAFASKNETRKAHSASMILLLVRVWHYETRVYGSVEMSESKQLHHARLCRQATRPLP